MEEHKGLPVVSFETPAQMEQWLESPAAEGFWLRIATKGSGTPSISYAEAVEVALCFGWIDGLKNSLDDTAWLQRFTPRKPASIWSQINRDKVGELIASGRMRPAGLAEVDRAKADGRWAAAYSSSKDMTAPEDFLDALSDAAIAFWGELDKANQYAMLHRIHTAKKPETRAKRIAEFGVMLAERRVLYPDRLPKRLREQA